MQLAEHGGKRGKKRAVIAVARKLAVLLHRRRLHPVRNVPRLRTSPSGSAMAAAIVSAWTSMPRSRNFSFMTGSFRLWL
jgi:hypothetical protein